jgi:hypothetical protein
MPKMKAIVFAYRGNTGDMGSKKFFGCIDNLHVRVPQKEAIIRQGWPG